MLLFYNSLSQPALLSLALHHTKDEQHVFLTRNTCDNIFFQQLHWSYYLILHHMECRSLEPGMKNSSTNIRIARLAGWQTNHLGKRTSSVKMNKTFIILNVQVFYKPPHENKTLRNKEKATKRSIQWDEVMGKIKRQEDCAFFMFPSACDWESLTLTKWMHSSNSFAAAHCSMAFFLTLYHDKY